MHDVPDRPFPPEDVADFQFAPAKRRQPARPALEDFANDFLAEEPEPEAASAPSRIAPPPAASFVREVPVPVAVPLPTGHSAVLKAALAIVVVLLCVGIGIVAGYALAQRVTRPERPAQQDAAVVSPPPAQPAPAPPVSSAPATPDTPPAPGPSKGSAASEVVRPQTKTTPLPVVSAPPRDASTRPGDLANRPASSRTPVSSPRPNPELTSPPQTTVPPSLTVTTDPWKPAAGTTSPVPLTQPPVAPAAADAPPAATNRGGDRAADNTEAAIRVVLDGYRQAYNKRDADGVGVVWPSANTKALAKAFSQLSDQRLNFDSCVIGTTGAAAQASCSGTAMYVPSVGNKSPHVESRRWTFHLQQTRSGWVIASVDSR